MIPRATRTPLRDVALHGVYRRVHQFDAIGRTVGAALVTVTLLLPWHRVHATNSLDLSAVFCAMTPDCHPGPSAPVHDIGIVTTCTGLTHGGPAVLLVAFVLIGIAAVPIRWPTFRASLACALVAEVLTLGLAGRTMFHLIHMFDRVEVLLGEHLFDGAIWILALSGLVELALQPWLFIRSRQVMESVRSPTV